MSTSALASRFQGRGTQFHVELLYGVLFVAGFAYLVFRVDPRVAAFEGGLVVGYLLRIWEKMSIYERIIEEAVSEEAETQVATEVEDRVPGEVQAEVEEQVTDEVATEVEDRVDEEVDRRLGARVEEEVSETVDSHIEETVDTELDDRLPEDVGDVDELLRAVREDDGTPDPGEFVVEEDVEDLVEAEVDAALDDETAPRDGT